MTKLKKSEPVPGLYPVRPPDLHPGELPDQAVINAIRLRFPGWDGANWTIIYGQLDDDGKGIGEMRLMTTFEVRMHFARRHQPRHLDISRPGTTDAEVVELLAMPSPTLRSAKWFEDATKPNGIDPDLLKAAALDGRLRRSQKNPQGTRWLHDVHEVAERHPRYAAMIRAAFRSEQNRNGSEPTGGTAI